MTQTIRLFLACSVFLATPVWSQEQEAYAPLNLAEFGRVDLVEVRQGLMAKLIESPVENASQDDLRARAEAYLDLAELHLAQMLRPEAEGYLAAIDPSILTPQAAARHRTLTAALALLSEDAEAAQIAAAPWPGGQALRVVALHRAGDSDGAKAALPGLTDAFPALSPAMTAALLPDLLEAALAAEDWPLAQSLAQRFPNHAELNDSPAYWFLIARAAEMSGDMITAFDGYATAAGGRDAYAHRARLALAALGRRTETLSLSEAVRYLKSARWFWSGDAVAIEGKELLASYALELEDWEGALWALGHLLTEAQTPQEEEALRVRARAAVADFYAAGASGALPLSAFLEGHAKILPGWRFDDRFVEKAAALPEKLLEIGMTGMAAREFRNLYDLAEAAAELVEAPTDPALLDRLRLGQARALLAGGQADAAVDLLAPVATTGDATPEMETMLIQALSASGRSDELAQLRGRALDLNARRDRAIALYETENWAAAQEAFLDLWAANPTQFGFADATRLVLSAYEMRDAETVSRVATAFPSLTDMPGWAEIAARLQDQADTPESFGLDVMRASMADADRVLDAVATATAGKDSE